MLNRYVILLRCLVVAVCLFSCGTVQVYKEPGEPIFLSNQLSQTLGDADSLNVVTFNIKEAEKIDLAISELQQLEKTHTIDVYLLQEVDEKGVEMLASQLKLNYLYIPIVYNKIVKKNIGNAILTKGTVGHPEKLILPHSKWVNNRRRHAAIAEVSIHQQKILVFSTHTETVSMSRKKRMDQVDAMIENAKTKFPTYEHILIGGDLNTVFNGDLRRVVEKFNASGFEWATDSVGPTASAMFGLVKPKHDNIFSKGFKVIRAFTVKSSKASDHYPVFASFRY